MERTRSLPRSFSLKPTRLLLLSSTISSSLLFCIYFSFWLLDSTPSDHSAAYFQLIGGVKIPKVHSFAAPSSSLVVNGTGNPITEETLTIATGNPSLESLDVEKAQNDGVLNEFRVREAADSSIEELDSEDGRANANVMFFGDTTTSGGNPSMSEKKNSTDLADDKLEESYGLSDDVIASNSELDNRSFKSLDVGEQRKDERLSNDQVSEAVDSSIEELDSADDRANDNDTLFNDTISGDNPSIFEDKNSSNLPDVNLKQSYDLSDELLDSNSESDDGDTEKEEVEDDIMMGNRSSYSSLDQSKVSLVDNNETEGTSTCDITDGRWVFDESYPLYPANSCPFVDEGFSCVANGRIDNDYMKWRWQPNGCSIPRFNPVKMLELIRGKRLVFVGDSINRNQWESMLCMLRTALSDPSRVYEAHRRRITKNRGNYNFKFPDYGCSVEYYVTHHLVHEGKARIGQRRVSTLRIDTVDRGSSRWRGADILVFNSAHWWSHHKTKAGVNYYQEGNRVHPRLDVSTAFRKALSTWALWVDQHVIPGKTQVFFRSSAPSHFSGGEWNSGGHCKESIHPLNKTYVRQVPEKNIILEQVVKKMKTPVTILNITNLSGLRIDGHPSVYGRTLGRPPTSIQDCSHWCLPGVPDTWNELLYFHLLSRNKAAVAS
ncbi:protein trichome birefringence-like 6 [Canna indica]|uniref:Protein trichome birefringence-like 6 n=1 Tax=Canna indica TaxID=4628 RepID=A0AAQ3Q7B6_9LILI|nr:protein trichome birefringence-like 6 [Canna indica]